MHGSLSMQIYNTAATVCNTGAEINMQVMNAVFVSQSICGSI